jgi:hypothetical protein
MNALPVPHPEDVQINVIYSLLKPKIHKKVPRETIGSLNQLIDTAHRAEQSKNDKWVRRFEIYDFRAMRLAAKLKEKYSLCRTRKSKRSRGTEIKCGIRTDISVAKIASPKQ